MPCRLITPSSQQMTFQIFAHHTCTLLAYCILVNYITYSELAFRLVEASLSTFVSSKAQIWTLYQKLVSCNGLFSSPVDKVYFLQAVSMALLVLT